MVGPDFGFVLSGLAYGPNLKSIYLSRLRYRVLNRNLPAVWFSTVRSGSVLLMV